MLGIHQPLTPKIGEPPPTSFKIFSRGENQTIDGLTFIYNDEAAASILAVWKGHDTPLHIDFEHSSEAPADTVSTQGAPAQGWFDIEDRPDGLYAVNVKWLDPAKTYISEGKYRLFSPVFEATKDGTIVHLKSLGLTNIPRLNGLTPLVRCKTCGENHSDKTHDTKPAKGRAKDTTMAKAAGKVEEKVEEAKDEKDMSLDEHAKCMKDNLDEQKGMHADAKDMHKESMKAFKDLTGALTAKSEKAKEDDEDDDNDDDSDKEQKEAKMKTVETAKGALDAAIGKTVTPSEAKEFKAKMEKGEVTPDYVMGYLTTAKALPTAEVVSPPAKATGARFGFTDAAVQKCSQRDANWRADAKKLATATEAETYAEKLCRVDGVDTEKVAAAWRKNAEQWAAMEEAGYFKGLTIGGKPSGKNIRSI